LEQLEDLTSKKQVVNWVKNVQLFILSNHLLVLKVFDYTFAENGLYALKKGEIIEIKVKFYNYYLL